MEKGISPEDLKEYDDLCVEAESQYFVKNHIDLLDWMPEELVPRYKELYRKINGFCADGSCGEKDCENWPGDIKI